MVLPAARELAYFLLRNNRDVVRVGDHILLWPARANESLYVARVERIFADILDNINVRVRWYYRPDDTTIGRLAYHGCHEVFYSDDICDQEEEAIEGVCRVHTLEQYNALQVAEENKDFFCRMQYNHLTGDFLVQEFLPLHCVCNMPENPDLLMIQCESCCRWFHPPCLNLSAEQTVADHFVCMDCCPNHAPPWLQAGWPGPFITPLLDKLVTSRQAEQKNPLFSQPWPIVLHVATCKEPELPMRQWVVATISSFCLSIISGRDELKADCFKYAIRDNNHPVLSTKCKAHWVVIATKWNQEGKICIFKQVDPSH